jgi:thiamine biosynthesis protein ThiS
LGQVKISIYFALKDLKYLDYNLLMTLYINGFSYKLNRHVSIEQIFIFFKWNKKTITVEHNYKIIQQHLWSKIYLKREDNFEILTLVGGG